MTEGPVSRLQTLAVGVLPCRYFSVTYCAPQKLLRACDVALNQSHLVENWD
jgi:hypothetical protein